MKRVLTATLIALVTFCSASSALASEGRRNLTEEANKLRSQANEQRKSGDFNAALNSLTQCIDIIQMKEYKSPSKNLMIQSLGIQMGGIGQALYTKRQWADAEKAYRKKLDFLEKFELTKTNDYQSTLRMIEMTLRAQNRSTQASEFRSKIKPLSKKPDSIIAPIPVKNPEEEKKEKGQ